MTQRSNAWSVQAKHPSKMRWSSFLFGCALAAISVGRFATGAVGLDSREILLYTALFYGACGVLLGGGVLLSLFDRHRAGGRLLLQCGGMLLVGAFSVWGIAILSDVARAHFR
jgi:hypothetical protein